MKVENINIRKANLEDVKSNLLDIYILMVTNIIMKVDLIFFRIRMKKT